MTNPPPTPGEVLRRLILNKLKITQEQLANAMGISRYSINQLVNDRRGVTPEMALRLSRATSTSPEFWLNLQRQVDLYDAQYRLAKELDKIQPLRDPIPEDKLFRRHGD